jgi:PadR family transcriptional regulator PadR
MQSQWKCGFLMSFCTLCILARYLVLQGTGPFNAGRIMNLENTQVQMRKGILEFCVLHIISRGEVYASDLMDELTNARMIVVEGTLYPLLTRLKNAGLLEHKWVESPTGPPRKYYKLTNKGMKFLAGLTSTWEDLVRSTELIIARSKKPA